ncbi:hypothetical protein DIPPA_08631 [Diplonema papillatum]|nr:hypothetical protein DIPPA_08631 [Diplonema papillatum]|eukprot:gene6744-10339_t
MDRSPESQPSGSGEKSSPCVQAVASPPETVLNPILSTESRSSTTDSKASETHGGSSAKKRLPRYHTRVQTRVLMRPNKIIHTGEASVAYSAGAGLSFVHFTVLSGFIAKFVMLSLGVRWTRYCPSKERLLKFFRVQWAVCGAIALGLTMAMILTSVDRGSICCTDKGTMSLTLGLQEQQEMVDQCDDPQVPPCNAYGSQLWDQYCNDDVIGKVFDFYAATELSKSLQTRIVLLAIDVPLSFLDLFDVGQTFRLPILAYAAVKIALAVATVCTFYDKSLIFISSCHYWQLTGDTFGPTSSYQLCLAFADACQNRVGWLHSYDNAFVYLIASNLAIVVVMVDTALSFVSYASRLSCARRAALTNAF